MIWFAKSSYLLKRYAYLEIGNVGVFDNAKDWHSGFHVLRGAAIPHVALRYPTTSSLRGMQFHASFVFNSLNDCMNSNNHFKTNLL